MRTCTLYKIKYYMKHSYVTSSETNVVYVIGYVNPISWYTNVALNDINSLNYSIK